MRSSEAVTPAPMLLGAFLRARRERIQPQDVGLPPGIRRRAPGLRREEAAALCGISPTWYTWIEQGRTAAISVATLGAIARGLRLSQAERLYLFELAACADPAPRDSHAADAGQLAALVQAVASPAYVLDRHWDAVVWNAPAAALFEGWLGDAATDVAAPRNLLRYVFLDAQAQQFIVNWPERAQRVVAEFRADTAAWHDDPVRQALVEELCWASPDFAEAWRTQQVLARDGGARRFAHARWGRRDYTQTTLRLALQPDIKLIVLVPAGVALATA